MKERLKGLFKGHVLSEGATKYLWAAGIRNIGLGLIGILGPTYFPLFMLSSPIAAPFWGWVLAALYGSVGLVCFASTVLDSTRLARLSIGLTIILTVAWLSSLVFVALAGTAYPPAGYFVFCAVVIAKDFIALSYPIAFEDSLKVLARKKQTDKTEQLLKEVQQDNLAGG